MVVFVVGDYAGLDCGFGGEDLFELVENVELVGGGKSVSGVRRVREGVGGQVTYHWHAIDADREEQEGKDDMLYDCMDIHLYSSICLVFSFLVVCDLDQWWEKVAPQAFKHRQDFQRSNTHSPLSFSNPHI